MRQVEAGPQEELRIMPAFRPEPQDPGTAACLAFLPANHGE